MGQVSSPATSLPALRIRGSLPSSSTAPLPPHPLRHKLGRAAARLVVKDQRQVAGGQHDLAAGTTEGGWGGSGWPRPHARCMHALHVRQRHQFCPRLTSFM